MGASVFAGCSSLQSISIPEGVTSIPMFTFEGCQSLYSVVLPSSLENIDWTAFGNCGALQTLTIPSGVIEFENSTYLAGCLFSGCDNLLKVDFEGHPPEGLERYIGCNALLRYNFAYAVEWENILTCFGIENAASYIPDETIAGSVDADVDGLSDYEETDKSYTNPQMWDTDGDNMPDGWESVFAGTDPLYFDSDAVDSDDVMAYAVTNMTIIGIHDTSGATNDAEYILMSGENVPYIGDVVKGLRVYSLYDYAGNIGRGMPLTLNSSSNEFRVISVGKSDVVLVHSQVYEVFGFNPNTCITGDSAVNTKPFTALDKYLLLRYFASQGLCSENDVNRNRTWSAYTLKPMCKDCDLDGMDDGWELYVGLSPFDYEDRESDVGGDGKRAIEHFMSHPKEDPHKNSTSSPAVSATETINEITLTYVSSNGSVKVVSASNMSNKSVIVPETICGEPVTEIGSEAFLDCVEMTSVTIPASVTEIGSGAFCGCEKLADVYFEGDKIEKLGRHAFLGCSWDLIMHVPAAWQGRGRTIAGYSVWRGGSSDEEKSVSMTVTNVVVQYVLNSVQSSMATPVGEAGLVNIITEVKSAGAVSVPTEWKANYPTFESKYGTDFAKALMTKSGKKDAAGGDMFVWQDFVAGTDPTDPESKFVASVTMVGGVPVISYSPELSETEKAKRVYRTLGKTKIIDAEWTEVPAGSESDYNFFKVTVEMK